MKAWLLVSAVCLLVGCEKVVSPYAGELGCAADDGMGCMSMSKVAEKVDDGSFDDQGQSRTFYAQEGFNNTVNGVERLPEKVLRVWISGYETAEGDYEEGSYVNIVARKSRWIK